MSTVPGPARRLWRDRPRLVAVGLLAVTAVAASALQSTSAVVLQQTLDESWRGTYDILVTQKGKDPTVAGLLNSDALVDATMGRLGMNDLALIRALPGVEVAAPIAEVSFAERDLMGDPVVWVPVPVRADASLEDPQAFRVTVSAATDDGVSSRDLAPQSLVAFAYQPRISQTIFDTDGSPLLDEQGRVVTQQKYDSPRLLAADATVLFATSAYDAGSGTIALGLSLAPRPAAMIALVDPVAERALLGEAGAFLDPIIDHTGAREPVVVLDRQVPPLRLQVRVEEFDSVAPGSAGQEAVDQAQSTGFLQNGQVAPTIPADATSSVVGEYRLDASSTLDPFGGARLLLGGVTDERTSGAMGATGGPEPRSVLGARYRIPEDAAATGLGASLLPRGYSTFGQYSEAPLSGAAPPGSVTEYAKLFGAVGAGGALLSDEDVADHFDVVGSFRPDELRALSGDVSFMPLGAYDVQAPTLVADAAGEAITPRPLAGSLTGFGIPGTNAIAVGSFDMLDGLDVDRPISAIRIRVAGIDGYTADAQQRLLTAASGLESLGYHATIVAGSSPQALRVLVSGYALATQDDAGDQPIADLGYIDQEWSRLGAVVEADTAVSATSLALLAVAIPAVAVLLSAVQVASIPGRRATAGVLRQLGWRRGRVVRWFLAEEALAFAGVTLVGAVAVALSSVPVIAAVSVGVALALLAVTSLLAVGGGSRAARVRSRSARGGRIAGPGAFGVRRARTQVAGSLSLALALVLVTVAVAIGTAVFVQGRALAGPSALGAVASARAWLPQGVLAAVGLMSGIVLAVLSRRMTLGRDRDQWTALTAMGWGRGELIRAQGAELAFSAVPGLLVGLAISAAIAAQIAGLLLPVLLASGIAGVIAVGVVFAAGRKLD